MSGVNCFSKHHRIRAKKDFHSLRALSKLIRSENIHLYYSLRPILNEGMIAFSISKKVDNAVYRNRLKRLLKEEFRVSRFKTLPFMGLIVVRPKANFLREEREKKCLEDFGVVLDRLEKECRNSK